MSLTHAALWVTGVTLAFLWLATLAVSLRESAARDLFVQFMCQVAAYSLGLFALLRLYAPDTSIRQFLAFRRTHVGFYALALCLGVALVLPANVLFELSHWLFPQLDRPTDVTTLFYAASTRDRWLMGFAIGLAGPIIEEVLFRGALFGPLLRTHRPLTVMLGTGAYFALVHLDPHTMVPIFIVGSLLGYLRVASGSIVPAVIMHAAFNGVPLVTMVLGDKPSAPSGALDIPILATVLCVLASVGLGFAIHYLGRRSAQARVARSRDG